MTTAQLNDTAKTFLRHLASHGFVTAAAAAAGISTQAIYKRRAKDEAFARQWEAALTTAQELIGKALMRAGAGMDEAQRMLGEIADRLKNPDLNSSDRSTHVAHLQALGERVDELKKLANREVAKAH